MNGVTGVIAGQGLVGSGVTGGNSYTIHTVDTSHTRAPARARETPIPGSRRPCRIEQPINQPTGVKARGARAAIQTGAAHVMTPDPNVGIRATAEQQNGRTSPVDPEADPQPLEESR